MSHLAHYLENTPAEEQKKETIAYLAAIDHLSEAHPEIGEAIASELATQRSHLKLIASENYCSLSVQLAMGNLLTDKYAEGYIGHRYYAGCENIDAIESTAVRHLKELFGCEHAYVQPHSGADANWIAFSAILTTRVQKPFLEKRGKKLMELTNEEHEELRKEMTSQKMLAMGLGSGGHISHGYRFNFSSKIFQASHYEVSPESGLIDYDALENQVKKEKPLLLIAGYSAYSRLINFAKMREIADSVGAVLMVDMAHFAGLVAGKVITGVNNPIPYADIVTSTTHKTLRGPRGGIVLCKKEFKEAVDLGCPSVMGGPLPQVMAAKAIAFKEALTPEFKNYSAQVVKNAKAFAKALQDKGAHVLTGGTDNHIVIVDTVKSFGLNGRQSEKALFEAGITVNRNAIPFDPLGAWFTSGIRLGTPALTSLHMKEEEMELVADIICQLLGSCTPDKESKARYVVAGEVIAEQRARVEELLMRFPLYPDLHLGAASQLM